MTDQAMSKTPGPGHNNPPDPLGDALKALIALGFGKIAERVEAMVRGANEWRARIKEIKSAEVAAACEGFIEQARVEWQAVEKLRKEKRAPHDKEVDKIQTAFKPVLALLEECGKGLKPLKAGWLAREQARIDEEAAAKAREAKRLMDEAEEAAAAAQRPHAKVEEVVAAREAITKAETAQVEAEDAAKAKPGVRSDFGSRSSGFRTVYSATVEDWPKAAAHFANNAKVREAIQAAANAQAKTEKDAFSAPGCKVKSEKVV